MKLWLVLGILSYLFYAISTSIDKHFMNKKYDIFSTNTFKMFFNAIILLIIGLIFFKLNFTSKLFFWSLILGGIYALSGIIYFASLKLKDVEIVVPYYQSYLLFFTFIFSVILLNESVNIYNYIGIILLLIGVYTILSENGFKIPKLDKAIFLILIMVVLNLVYNILAKKILYDIKPIDLAIMMYFSCTIFLVAYILLSKKQRSLFDVKSSRIIFASIFGAMGTLLLYFALSVGNASKVYPIAGLQPFFVFIIAYIFLKTRFYWHRLIGTVIVFFGIFLISL